ncbi:MAG TPA: tetratricopeptide repeat protein [Anaeromyxobacteraceae bacterium]|nr:tetratricopeptide repeat protein [Anaeromyxobacteraceae bacterium]
MLSTLPLAVAMLVAAAPAAAAPAVPVPGERASALRGEAMELLALDDEAGLARAAALLEEAERVDPALWQARADRALVELLDAAAHRDEATRLADGAALMQGGRDLRERALDRLRPLARAHPDDAAVVRALAVYAGLDGNHADAARLVARARAAGTADAWIDFAEVAARAGAAGRAGSAPVLEAFVASHPRLGRPRMMLARTLFDLGHTEAALAALDELLLLSPEHARAKRLKADILSPPAGQVVFQPAPDDAPPTRPLGLLPRKPKDGR